MSRTDYRPALLLMALGLAPSPARAGAAISVAEPPARLLRGTSFHVAARGTQLQAGDIVEAGTASRIYFKPGGKAFEPVLLDG